MAEQVVLRGCLVLPDAVVPDGEVTIQEGRIVDVSRVPTGLRATHRFSEGWIFPGLVDVHVHGSRGDDVMDASPSSLARIDRALLSAGTTRWLATTMSEHLPRLSVVLQNIVDFVGANDSGILGVHLEGPYINSTRAGAQRADALRAPSISELELLVKILGRLPKRMTMAPEVLGADKALEFCQRHGIITSLGHSEATYDEAMTAFDAGASSVTHLFNAMTDLTHRAPGLAGAALVRPGVAIELIADGHHVHPGIVQLAARVKGPLDLMLVTDAMRAAQSPDGTYDLGGQLVTVAGGVARTAEGRLAGSTLTLLEAVWNYRGYADVPLADAVRAASLNPARHLGLADRGALHPGYVADVLYVDAAGRCAMAWRDGQRMDVL